MDSRMVGSRTEDIHRPDNCSIAGDKPDKVPADSHFAHCTAGGPHREHMVLAAYSPSGSRCLAGSLLVGSQALVVAQVFVAQVVDRADMLDGSRVPPLDVPQGCR